MGIRQKQENQEKKIQTFLEKHLSRNNSLFNQDMLKQIIELLHTKGKIFNEQENSFSWGQFYLHVCSLTFNEHTCNHSLIANAGAIELLILATDLIDEIVDDDDGFMSTMTLSEAITISNALLMDAFDLLLEHAPNNTHARFSTLFKQLKVACNGQWKDFKLVVSETIPSEEDYFQVIEQKSASLIQLVCSLANPSNPQRLSRIAMNIGIAGQLKNDANDIFIDSKTDLNHKKATLPVIKAIEFSLEKDNGLLLHKYHNLTEGDTELKEEIRDYIRKTGAQDYCIILSKLYIKKAIEELYETFPNKQTEIERVQDYLS